MGQLERYGLYVLVLVIFLILGVAIWGNDPADMGVANHGSDVRETLRASDPGEPLRGNPPGTLSDALANKFEFTKFDPQPADARNSRTVDAGGSAEDAPIGETAVNDAAGLLALDAVPSEAGPAPRSGGAAAGSPNVASTLRDYTIKQGDTLSGISQAFYGTQKYWQLIHLQNPNIDPNRLAAGTVIQVPHPDAVTGAAAKAAAESGAAEPTKSEGTKSTTATPDSYVVKKGDSLSVISSRVYGTSKHAALIQQANGIKDPKQIKPGDLLKIPALPVKADSRKSDDGAAANGPAAKRGD